MIHKQKCHQQESPKWRTLSHFYMAATLIPSPPQFWWSRPARHLFQRFTVVFFVRLNRVSIPVLNDSGRRWRRWWGGQVLRTEGYAVAQRPEPSERHYTWKKTVTTKYRGIQTWDVEDLKGGRKIPEIWGKIIVCFKVFVCICKIEIYVMSDLAKICSAWSCWTHLIQRHTAKVLQFHS